MGTPPYLPLCQLVHSPCVPLFSSAGDFSGRGLNDSYSSSEPYYSNFSDQGVSDLGYGGEWTGLVTIKRLFVNDN